MATANQKSGSSKFPMTLTASWSKNLLFRSMTAQESLGQLFEFDVEALAKVRDQATDDALGKPASVCVELSSGAKRYFHGILCTLGTHTVALDAFQYSLGLKPWLWLLTRRTDTRVFQKMTVQDILKKVFDLFSPDYEFKLQGTYAPYEYCVQYRESDFNFASRLMEQEGIYYYFKHTEDKHTMVIVDKASAHLTNPMQGDFDYREAEGGHLQSDAISQWKARKEIQFGKVVLNDYDFKIPKTKLEVTAKATRPKALEKLEYYDFPGTYDTKADGQRYSHLRIEELQAQYSRVDGAGSLRAMACGYRFELRAHPDKTSNCAHLVVSTRFEMGYAGYASGQDETFCRCQFSAIEGSEIFRPRRVTPKPAVAGLHTAVVVGPSGEEIHTDAHGRVKIQFHWDRLGKSDEKSSCFVRVSNPAAGKGFGAISLPRIGQEVIVDFMEGDPDRPMITGRVYNGEQVPPYALPANATVSTHKSRSSKSGAATNFNEIRFEDKKDAEYVWLQAEKDFHQVVKNDATVWITGNQDTLTKKNLTTQVDGDVKSKYGKDHVVQVEGSSSLKVTKDVMLEAGASLSHKSGANHDVKVGANLGVDAAANVHIKGGANVVIEAGAMMTLKAGGSTVVIGPAGVMIVGTMVMINSGGGGGAGSGANPKPVLQVTAPKEKADPLA
jgi:type VI secretion system secreted protein VgrG